MHSMFGVELGYTYAESALVCHEPDNPVDWDLLSYTPHARPGVRIPHMRLADGQALQDILGDDYNIVDLTGSADTSALEAALSEIGASVQVTRLDEPNLRDVYGCSLLLLRPDLHVIWRGNSVPEDPRHLAAIATGHEPAVRPDA